MIVEDVSWSALDARAFAMLKVLTCGMITVLLPIPVTPPPCGATPLAVAMLSIVPASTSA